MQPSQTKEQNRTRVKQSGAAMLLVLCALVAAGCMAMNFHPGAGVPAAKREAAPADVVYLTISGGSPGTEADFTKQKNRRVERRQP